MVVHITSSPGEECSYLRSFLRVSTVHLNNTVIFFFFLNAGTLKIRVGEKPNFQKCQQCYHIVRATQIK